jgi:hypothetical protein
MSKHQELKTKYKNIPTYSSVFNPEPWLDYPSLIEEMLEVIRCQEEAIKWYKGLWEIKNKE